MKVFVKRYPEKGEFPENNGWYLGSGGMHQYSTEYDFYDNIKWWLEEIELPVQKKLEMSHGIEYKPDLNGYTNGYIRGYKKAVRSIINLLK